MLLLAKCVAAAGILYHIYSLMIRATSPGYIRPIHVCFLVIMAYLVAPKPGKKKGTILFWWIAGHGAGLRRNRFHGLYFHRPAILDDALAIFVHGPGLFLFIRNRHCDIGDGSEAGGLAHGPSGRRGMVYCLFGHYLSGSFRILQITPRKMMTTMYFMQDGFFSSLIGVCLSYVLPFVFVGKLMELCGTGDYFTELAAKLTGRSRGGPAKVAIVSSALFGTVSGAGTANVVGHRNLHHPAHETDRLSQPLCRGGGGGGFHRRADHAAHHGLRRVFGRGSQRHPLWPAGHRRSHPRSDLLCEPLFFH